ncbi:MAG: metal ABC transporter permease [Oligoflexia bacterium]|nr:metal ABC transporter permease [Oligoflexia bacterium]MBF0364177.1 metal ABC transporter permease [Oligoflexia bacterium]
MLSDFWSALLSEAFLQNAIIGGALASFVCGVMGPFVYVRQIGYVAGAIAHTVLGGMGMAFYFGFSPMLGALTSAVAAAFLIGWVSLYHRDREDSIINALWAAGMAVGIIFIYKTPGYDVQLLSYLFGNILMITYDDLKLMAVLGVIIFTCIMLFYPKLLAVAFDEEFARIRKINVRFYYFMLLVLIAITTVLLVQIVGLVLVITLLVLPTATAATFKRSMVGIMGGAVVGGLLLTEGGVFLSYGLNLPSGPTVILLCTVVYLLAISYRWLKS